MLIKYLSYALLLLVSCNSASSAEESTGQIKTEKKFESVAENRTKQSGSIISLASSNLRLNENDEPNAPVLQMQLSAWKNERVSCQVGVWAKSDISNFKLVLNNTSDASFSEDNVHCRFLQNVIADNSAGYCGSVPKNLPQILVPDEISNNESGDIKAGHLQAIWISIKVPQNIKEGTHIIYLQPQASTGSSNFEKLTVKINVNHNTLPNPQEWSFHLDLWQYPLRVAKYYKVQPWSDEHFKLMKPTMQMLANAGQKAITASFFWDNMNNENYGFDNLMVKVKRNANASLSFDFTNFDKWVQFMMDLGIKDQINCFGMYPFTGNFNYYITDSAQSKTVTNSFTLNSNDYKTFWTSFLKSFAQHLKAKGWMNKTVLYFDERPFKNVIDLATFIKAIDPSFKIGYTGGYNQTLTSLLYDFSIPSYLKMNNDDLARRNANNLVTTFYTTCTEKKPNQFTFSNPAESVFMGWYAFANNYKGYLRYAFNMWEKNSKTDTRSALVPAGDKFMIYPDSYSSVRFEKLVQGIQDYEKLNAILNEQRNRNNAGLQKLADVVKNCSINNVKNISAYNKFIDNAEQILNSF